MVAWYFVSNELNELAYFSSKSSSFNHMHSRSRTIIGSHDGSINETVQIIVVAFNYHHRPNPNPAHNIAHNICAVAFVLGVRRRYVWAYIETVSTSQPDDSGVKRVIWPLR